MDYRSDHRWIRGKQSFLALFIIDAIISCIVAVLFYLLISETKPEPQPGQQHESIFHTFKGYGVVIRDYAFMAFWSQDDHGGSLPADVQFTFGLSQGCTWHSYIGVWMLTASAVVVILFQFTVTRLDKAPATVSDDGIWNHLLHDRFSMFGFVSVFWLFILAVVIITIGEMIIMPVTSALAANFAPATDAGTIYGGIWFNLDDSGDRIS